MYTFVRILKVGGWGNVGTAGPIVFSKQCLDYKQRSESPNKMYTNSITPTFSLHFLKFNVMMECLSIVLIYNIYGWRKQYLY